MYGAAGRVKAILEHESGLPFIENTHQLGDKRKAKAWVGSNRDSLVTSG